MSHFSTIKTQFQDKQILICALANLGLLGVWYQTTVVAAYTEDNSQQVSDAVVIKARDIPSSRTLKADIAYVKNGDYYELVSDQWELQAFSKLPENWPDQVANEYALEVVKRIAASKNYQIQSCDRGADGSIKIQLGV